MALPITFLAATLSRENPKDRPTVLTSKITVKRGAEILEGPYPKKFSEYIGQTKARMMLMAAVESAVEREEPMGHVIITSGVPGIGKTALARLTAHMLGGGFVELGGKVTDMNAATALREMRDGDVLFLDEIHRLVQGGKAGAEWLLTLLQDGTLHTPGGVIQAPKITVLAATTDKQRLPETMLERFKVVNLDHYTAAEALAIARLHAKRVGFGKSIPMPEAEDWLAAVARACDRNPRRMGFLLETVRDVAIASRKEDGTPGILTDDGYDLTIPLDYEGLTWDGLTMDMQEYLAALYMQGGKAGIGTLKAMVNEEKVEHTEKALIQRGYIVIATGGRVLTEDGITRASECANDLAAKAAEREGA